jgi:putative nucleotidyltransferase with HDIG domain
MAEADTVIRLDIIERWQGTIDLVAEIMKVPAALIKRVEQSEIVVFVASQSPGNAYKPGDKVSANAGSYCETVISTRESLLVPDAAEDHRWTSTPDVKLGMISYLGYPLRWPGQNVFGTICVLDNKKNAHNELPQRLLLQIRDIIEADLKYLFIVNDFARETARAREALLKVVEDQKRAAEVLRESEVRFRHIVTGSADGVVIVDRHGTLRFVNPAAESIFDRKAEELLGTLLGFPLVTGETMEIDIIRRGGKPAVAEMRVVETEWEGESACLATIRDVTERKRAEEEIWQRFEMLQKTSQGTVDALAATAEMQDLYTAGHQRRVTQLARAIAKEMSLPEDQIDGLRAAAALHDVGKIDVPAEILSKPGSLTESEMRIIRSHPQVGHDILKTVPFAWPVADIVLQHHERMDGSGYPSGLKGKDILIEARILGVADVVEAMCFHRTHRQGLGVEKALEDISQNAGTLYDPKVADACSRLFKEKCFKCE